jgi:hypothetical protein
MIFNGPRLLVSPAKSWLGTVGSRPRPPIWLIAAALTAAIWPAVGVVAGHIGSFFVGVETVQVATLRAAVGLTSAVGGALVLAPALTLILLRSTVAAHSYTPPRQAVPFAMGFLWPAWCAGVVLAFPPLVGLGPEAGEIAWVILATVGVLRACNATTLASLGIRRRWARRFVLRFVTSFLLVFAIVVIGPAMVARSILGGATAFVPQAPTNTELPTPPKPDW